MKLLLVWAIIVWMWPVDGRVTVHRVGSGVPYHCSCPGPNPCDAIQWSLNGTVLDESLEYVKRIRFNVMTRTGKLKLVQLSREMNGSVLECIYLKDGVRTWNHTVTTLFVEGDPASPDSLTINSTLDDDLYIISWATIVTADPHPHYCVRTPGTEGLDCTVTDTEYRFPKSDCSVACGECVFGVSGKTQVGTGPLATVSVSSLHGEGYVVADSLEVSDMLFSDAGVAYVIMQATVEPSICSGNVTITNEATGLELLAEDFTVTTVGAERSLVTFNVAEFRKEHSYELTFSFTNSAGIAQSQPLFIKANGTVPTSTSNTTSGSKASGVGHGVLMIGIAASLIVILTNVGEDYV